MATALINGVAIDSLSVWDRGLQYGDAIFETLAVEAGQPYLWHQHLTRLRRGCERLGIPLPDLQLLSTEVNTLLSSCDIGVLKVMLTRGCGGRGYRAMPINEPTRILSIHPRPIDPIAWWRLGIKARLCTTTIGLSPALAGIKHSNRLEQVLARTEWNDADIAEGLQQDVNSHWISGTRTNLFVVFEHCLLTPRLQNCGVAGVMRDLIMQKAKEQRMPVVEGFVSSKALTQARGIFLTNSLIGMWPVYELAGHHYDPDVIPAKIRANWLKNVTYSDIYTVLMS